MIIGASLDPYGYTIYYIDGWFPPPIKPLVPPIPVIIYPAPSSKENCIPPIPVITLLPPGAPILLIWCYWLGAFYPSFLVGTKFMLLVGVTY